MGREIEMKSIFKYMLLLMIFLPVGVASADKAKNIKTTGWVDKVIDRSPGYIVVGGVKYRVPTSAKVSERYSDTPLRLRHVAPGMKVEVYFRKKEKNAIRKLKSIEIIPQ